jgi:hypothetical protein
MTAWELDPTNPNPYEVAVKTPTQAAVRRELAEEEERALAAGVDVSLSDNVSPCSLIATGIDLEGEQYVPSILFGVVFELLTQALTEGVDEDTLGSFPRSSDHPGQATFECAYSKTRRMVQSSPAIHTDVRPIAETRAQEREHQTVRNQALVAFTDREASLV